MICDCGKGEATRHIEKDGETFFVCEKCYLRHKYGDSWHKILSSEDWKKLKRRIEKQRNYPNFF